MVSPYRMYRFKFYLNASHSTMFHGRQGEIHPHTWEFSLKIMTGRNSTVPFDVYEQAITTYLAPYQNSTLNTMPPFDTLIPTLENLVDNLGEGLRVVVAQQGGTLLEIEGSETPTRSYIVEYPQAFEMVRVPPPSTGTNLSSGFDDLLDSL